MGQKVNPIGFRLGIVKDWETHWFAERDYTKLLQEDIGLRRMISRELRDAAVPKIEIERSANQVTITIHTAKPGIVIGKSGAKVEDLRRRLEKSTSKKVRVNIQEIRQPELDATLVGRSIAEQLERRVAFRRAMKRAVQSALRLGAEGIRITCSGRLGGAEIARTEWYREGRVPLHTLRGNVDYAEATAHTAYGVCGVKVWVFKGEILGHDPLAQDRLMMEAQTSGVRPAREERGNR